MHVMNGTHPTTIGDDVTIGHGAIVHGCTLQNRILIGMGAILLNGVSSGRTHRRGRDVADGRHAGAAPVAGDGESGKVRRQLTDEDVASIRVYAERYVEYRLDYMDAVRAGSAADGVAADPPGARHARFPAGDVRRRE